MGDILVEVERWRMKADELRAVAAALSDEGARDLMLEMADGYDRLAGRMASLETRKGGAVPG